MLVLTPLAIACALAASRRRRRTLLQMAIGGTLMLLAVTIALARLLSTLSTRAAPRYQAVANVVVHALTNSFFTMTTWFVAGGFALAAVTLLSGPYRWSTTVRTALRIGLRRARELEALGFLQITLAAQEKIRRTAGFAVVA